MAPNAVTEATAFQASVIPELAEAELLTQVEDLEGKSSQPKTIAFIALGSRGDVQVGMFGIANMWGVIQLRLL